MKPYYEQHEQDIARMLGGKLTSSSGRHWQKGDVEVGDRDGGLLCDAKSTSMTSYRLTHGVWMKLWKEAGMVSRTPALPLRFIKANGYTLRDLIVVPQGEIDEVFPASEGKQSFVIRSTIDAPEPFVLFRGHSPARLVVLELDDFIERRGL